MIGQEIILNKIHSLSIDEFPHSLLLVGESGSGRHTLKDEIVNTFGFDTLDITNDLSLDMFTYINANPLPFFYVINCDEITCTNKSLIKQNSILKLLEEPTSVSFFILICKNKNDLLPTILNRCQIWELEKYTKDQLKQIHDDDLICSIASTPGEVLSIDYVHISDTFNFASKVFTAIGNANISNVLTISNRIKYKSNDDGQYDYYLFIKILLYSITELVKTETDPKYISAYTLTKKLVEDSQKSALDKQRLFENYLVNLKLCMVNK